MSKHCKKLSYADIGHPGQTHSPGFTEAIGPNYTASDIKNPDLAELTIQAFGFELGEDEAVKIRDLINGFLRDASQHHRNKAR